MSDEQRLQRARIHDYAATLETENGKLQERLARVTAERDALLALLRQLEWADEIIVEEDGYCPVCGSHRKKGHGTTCALAALLEGDTDD